MEDRASAASSEEAYEVFGAESLEGPYWSFGSVAINQPPQLKVPCNETGAYPALFAKARLIMVVVGKHFTSLLVVV